MPDIFLLFSELALLCLTGLLIYRVRSINKKHSPLLFDNAFDEDIDASSFNISTDIAVSYDTTEDDEIFIPMKTTVLRKYLAQASSQTSAVANRASNLVHHAGTSAHQAGAVVQGKASALANKFVVLTDNVSVLTTNNVEALKGNIVALKDNVVALKDNAVALKDNVIALRTNTVTPSSVEYELKMDSLKKSQIFAGMQLLEIKRAYGELHQDKLAWLREAISLYLIGAIDFIGKEKGCSRQSRKELVYLVLKSNLKLSLDNSETYFNEALYRQLQSDNHSMVMAGAKAAKVWLREETVPSDLTLSRHLEDWGIFA